MKDSIISDEKTGGFWKSYPYQKAMVYKFHFRLLVVHPSIALMWLVMYYIFGNNPDLYFAIAMALMLFVEGAAFIGRKFGASNKEVAVPLVSALICPLFGIMITALYIYVQSPLFSVNPTAFLLYGFYTFIVATSLFALGMAKVIKIKKVKQTDS